MATSTLSAIRTAIRGRGDYPTSAKFTDTVVDIEIQLAWAELWSLVDLACQGFWDKEGTIATVANQAYQALPSDALAVRGVDISLGGGEYKELDQVSIKDRNRYGGQTGRPIGYRLSSRGVEFYPTPNAIYTIRITYSPIVTPLSETPVQFYNGWEDYLIVGALLRLDTREEKPLDERLRELTRLEAVVKASVSSRKSSGPEYLTLHEHCNYEDVY